MLPRKNGRLLSVALEEIPAGLLVLGCVGELKIRPVAGEHQLKEVVGAGPVVELDKTARALPEVVKQVRLGRVQITFALEHVAKKKIAELFGMTAEVNREV